MPYRSSTLMQIVQLGLINAYLVREGDELTLIDALNPRGQKRILKAAASLNAPITKIVLTHAHPDHVGSLDALLKALPDAELIVGRRESRLLAGERDPEGDEPTDVKQPPKLKTKAEPTRLVDAGDMIGSLQVIAAPGHSPGQIALLDTRDDALICGDAYSTVGGVATTAGPYVKFPLPGFVTWHRPTALQTARELRDLNPSRLAPGHGKVVKDPGPAMDVAIKRSA